MGSFNPRASSEELAGLILGLPDGVDFSAEEVGILGKTLLTGKTEERDPMKYAQVFELASEGATSPWMRFACRAEEVNGMRRARGADMVGLADRLDQIAREANAALPNTSEKFGLLGNVLYNVALVKRGLRWYEEAAEAQLQSSGWYGLSGDRAKQLVGIFAAQVERVTAAFVAGEDVAIVRSIRALVAAREHVAHVVSPYPNWMVDNAAIHISWPLMMARIAGIPEVSWAWLEAQAADFQAGTGSRYPQWARVYSAWDFLKVGNYRQAAGEVPIDLPSSSADNAALSVHILVALAERALGITNALARLQAVGAHQGPDGGIPMAVARRLLAESF